MSKTLRMGSATKGQLQEDYVHDAGFYSPSLIAAIIAAILDFGGVSAQHAVHGARVEIMELLRVHAGLGREKFDS